MRLVKTMVLLVFAASALGCVYTNGPVITPLETNLTGPVSGNSYTSAATKVGKASAEGVILVGYGDASVGAAAKDGQITKIHRVESKSLNILNVYGRYTTIVYGE